VAARIHPQAFVDPSAQLGADVVVGPFAVVEAGAVVGDACELKPHSVVHTGVTLGKRNKVYPYAAVGGDPQDLKYKGQPTKLVLGDDNLVREAVTLNRGTEEGGGLTRIGSRNIFMAGSHIAHDCKVGDDCVFANSVAIAGHGEIGDLVVIGGLSGLHQHARVGTGAMVGGMARLSKDVPPFSTTSGTEEVKVYGLNKVGLRRRGLTRDEMNALENAYRIFQDSSLNAGDALAELEALPAKTTHIQILIDFLKTSSRGVYR
jgi:UDP-N-acetylglucosamine acyltransferase